MVKLMPLLKWATVALWMCFVALVWVAVIVPAVIGWYVLTDGVLKGDLRAQCLKVQPGMSTREVLQVVHENASPYDERDLDGRLVFVDEGGVCTVEVDRTTNKAARANYKLSEWGWAP